jgi:glycosyltransferase involved in cell wall biosynthesis
MTLKIGLVSGEFPPMEGGVGAFTRELAAGLNALGYEVHIITDRRARPEGAKRDFWNPRDPVETEYAQLHPRANRWWWSANSVIADIVLRYELDVVNVQYQAAAYDMRVPAINFLPWRLRDLTATVVTFHDLRHPYILPKVGRLRPWVVYNLARSADGVIVTNAGDLERLKEQGVPERLIRQIPIGSNVVVNHPAAGAILGARQALGISDEDYLLGYFGFINTSKGPDLLLKALAKLDDRYHLVFLGGKTGSSDKANRSYINEIEALIGTLGLGHRVHWSGFLGDSDLSTHFEACNMMVMPYRDGVSLRRGTLMAILAHGRPLVTSPAQSPVPPLVHGQNVWMTPVDDPVLLSDAIREVSADKELRNRLSSGALEVSRYFRWDRIAAETAQFYRTVRDDKLDKQD